MEGDVRQQGRLPRIAAALLALAALAERAALRSLPIRFLVLSILWHAEAIARNFVAGEMEDVWQGADAIGDYAGDADLFCSAPRWPGLDELLPPTGSTLDASLLALRLRMLATILLALADADRIYDDRCAGRFGHDFGDRTAHRVHDASTAPHVPLFLVMSFPVARYGVIRQPGMS